MEVNSSNKSTIDYPGYNIYLHYTLLCIFALYIPIILFSSSLVVSAVIFLKKLHHTQNYIILSISLMDVIIALAVIPGHLLFYIPQSREVLVSSMLLPQFLMRFIFLVNLIYLQFLGLLGLDTFLQVKYPITYWKHNSRKKAIVAVVGILMINISTFSIVTGIQANELSNPQKADELNASFRGVVAAIWCSSVVVLFLIAICVACFRWNRLFGAAERGTIFFLMAYFVFFCPTLITESTSLTKGQNKELWLIIGRMTRHLASVTNGLVIYLSRPIYKMAFQYFIRKSPLQWKQIGKYISARKTNPAAPITVSKKTDDIKEPKMSPSSTGLTSKGETSRKTSCSAGIYQDLSRDNHIEVNTEEQKNVEVIIENSASSVQ